ncbi:MAG TPA: class I SAM-dependent methyltransferase [Solirubrobacterales bacterium]|nr:class I SAM-dependent methyltransferase [Solirubrobacterales bacterium]
MSEIDPAKQAYETFAGVYDEFNSANDYEMWFGALLPPLEALGLRRGALLDVGCGTGRAIAPMLRRGWTVTACDISAAMVEKAREKFPDGVTFDVRDMRELPVYGSFELVWALNDPVNYLLGDDDLDAALTAMAANLAADGLLVFDTNTRRLFGELFGGADDEDMNDDSRWKWEGRGGDGTLFEARISGERIEPHLHRERHRSVEEVQAAMRAAGLTPLAAMGQSESEAGLALVDDWDEDRDHKIIHVARHA